MKRRRLKLYCLQGSALKAVLVSLTSSLKRAALITNEHLPSTRSVQNTDFLMSGFLRESGSRKGKSHENDGFCKAYEHVFKQRGSGALDCSALWRFLATVRCSFPGRLVARFVLTEQLKAIHSACFVRTHLYLNQIL